jgi:hypothetical protein
MVECLHFECAKNVFSLNDLPKGILTYRAPDDGITRTALVISPWCPRFILKADGPARAELQKQLEKLIGATMLAGVSGKGKIKLETLIQGMYESPDKMRSPVRA